MNILFFGEVDSTNDIALELARGGHPHGTVIAAESQRKGRGRRGRIWHSPHGNNIYMSIILRPKLPHANIPLLTPLIAIASAKKIKEIAGLETSIKWPNDIMASGKKLGGILVEMRQGDPEAPIIVAGIGINVNMEQADFPPELNATSILMETGRKHDKIPLIEAISGEILFRIDRFDKESLISEWRGMLNMFGKEVKVVTPKDTLAGIALDIDENGGLMIRLADGAIKTILAGDVE